MDTPVGPLGSWASFAGVSTAVAIDSAACEAHVVFRGKGSAAPPATDTAIIDAAFSLPGLTPAAVNVIAQEGVSAAPLPFPVGSVFGDFPASVPLAAAPGAVALTVGFRGQVTGTGVTGSNDTGVFVFDTGALPPIATAAREGDPTCAPSWSGAGTVYDDFPAELRIGVNGGLAPTVGYRAKSRGGSGSSDTALELSIVGSGCAASVVSVAAEGGATPSGGVYGDFSSSTPLSYGGGGSVFLAKIANLAGSSKGLFAGATFAAASVTVALHGTTTTGLGAGTVKLSSDPGPVINAASEILFATSVQGFSPSGLFRVDPISAAPAELVTFRGHNVQLDDLGGMTARFP